MKNKLLFPPAFRIAGWILLLLCTALFIVWSEGEFKFAFLDLHHTVPQPGNLGALFEDNNLTNEVAAIGILAGLVFIAFSRNRLEDERTSLLRLQSLQLSHYITYLVFAVSLFTVNGLSFFLVLIYMPYTFMVIFILIYYVRMYLLPKFAAHEE